VRYGGGATAISEISAACLRFVLRENMAKMQIPKSIRASKATPIPIPAFAPVLNPWLLESLELFEVLVGGDVKVTVAVTCGETLETVCKPIKANSELEDVVSIELGEAI
jgi:hypothetical protein